MYKHPPATSPVCMSVCIDLALHPNPLVSMGNCSTGLETCFKPVMLILAQH